MFIIFGPTASGKTRLALELAKKNNGEIISADSRQIFKYMSIGTGSSDNNIFKENGINIHLVEFLLPNEHYNVSQWQKAAYYLINQIQSKGKTPIIVGGTGLYIDSLLYKRDYGNNLDPLLPLEYNLITPNIERSVVYEKINSRVDEMFEAGFIEEVIWLKENNFANNKSIQGAGYKEILEYLENDEKLKSGELKIPPQIKDKVIVGLDMCKEKVKIAYRNYAKRQYTWFRKYFEDFEVEKV